MRWVSLFLCVAFAACPEWPEPTPCTIQNRCFEGVVSWKPTGTPTWPDASVSLSVNPEIQAAPPTGQGPGLQHVEARLGITPPREVIGRTFLTVALPDGGRLPARQYPFAATEPFEFNETLRICDSTQPGLVGSAVRFELLLADEETHAVLQETTQTVTLTCPRDNCDCR